MKNRKNVKFFFSRKTIDFLLCFFVFVDIFISSFVTHFLYFRRNGRFKSVSSHTLFLSPDLSQDATSHFTFYAWMHFNFERNIPNKNIRHCIALHCIFTLVLQNQPSFGQAGSWDVATAFIFLIFCWVHFQFCIVNVLSTIKPI